MMNWDLLPTDQLANWSWGHLVSGALAQFTTFLFVLTRLSGLMILGPVFGHATVPVNIRAMLAITLALLITPVVALQAQRGFEALDENADGMLAHHEVSESLSPQFTQLQQAAHRSPGEALRREDYRLTTKTPQTLGELVSALVLELCLGLLLSLGVAAILSCLQTAGQLIDQQAGFGLGQIFNPDFGMGGSTAGPLLYMLGLTIFLVLPPLGGHLQMVRVLLDTFQTLPPGGAVVSLSSIELLSALIQESLVLAIRMVAPLLIIMSLTDMLMGFLGHSVPQINIQAVGFGVRAISGVVLLALTVGSVPDVLGEAIPATLTAWRNSLVYPE